MVEEINDREIYDMHIWLSLKRNEERRREEMKILMKKGKQEKVNIWREINVSKQSKYNKYLWKQRSETEMKMKWLNDSNVNGMKHQWYFCLSLNL